MKKFIITAFAVAAALSVSAETMLEIKLADGSSPTYMLSEKPVLKCIGDNLTVTVNSASFSYKRADIVKMIFAENGAGVDDILSDEDRQLFSYLNNTITAPGMHIRLFSLSGALVAESMDCLDLNPMPAGIYVAKTKSHSVNIIKK
ncbi:MAG: hypothetical protein NC204_02300 [Candidatus Amulumruptor caecigallinarius]|nr:hypothetical protein [Candidatus Amulumruptor caecigallinarius]